MELKTESLILSCIGFGNRGSTLKNILSSCDYLNRGVLDKDELQKNLNTLLNNDFIYIKNNKFFTTEKAKSFYQANEKNEGCIAEWIRLSEILHNELPNQNGNELISISDSEYQKALSRNWFLVLLNKLITIF